MCSRGQSSLDLLLALIVVLVVLTSLNGVVSSYSSTQKEIALHQQLRETGFVSGVFLSGLTKSYPSPFSYPVRPGTFASLSGVVEGYVRGTGSMSLPPVRIAGYPQGVGCSIDVDWFDGSLALVALPSDSGLSIPVSYLQVMIPVSNYGSDHSFITDGCGSFIRVEGS